MLCTELLCRYSTSGADGGTYYVQLCADASHCGNGISMCHIDSSQQLHQLGLSSSSEFVQDGKLTISFVITRCRMMVMQEMCTTCTQLEYQRVAK